MVRARPASAAGHHIIVSCQSSTTPAPTTSRMVEPMYDVSTEDGRKHAVGEGQCRAASAIAST